MDNQSSFCFFHRSYHYCFYFEKINGLFHLLYTGHCCGALSGASSFIAYIYDGRKHWDAMSVVSVVGVEKRGFFSIYCVCVLFGRKRLFLSLLHGFTQRWTLITKFVSNLVLFSGFNQVSTASSWAVGDVFVRHLAVTGNSGMRASGICIC